MQAGWELVTRSLITVTGQLQGAFQPRALSPQVEAPTQSQATQELSNAPATHLEAGILPLQVMEPLMQLELHITQMQT